MRKPSIVSGVGKLRKDGTWVVISGDTVSKQYGSGSSEIIRPGLSGGVITNNEGKVLGVATAISDYYRPTRDELPGIADVSFPGLKGGEQRYAAQYGVAVTSTTIQKLRETVHPCTPGANDTDTVDPKLR